MTVSEMVHHAKMNLERAKILEQYENCAEGFTDEQRALFNAYVSDYGQRLETALNTNQDAMTALYNGIEIPKEIKKLAENDGVDLALPA